MDMKSVALSMYPLWLLGAGIIWGIAKSKYKNDIRIEPKAVGKWLKFLGAITIYRIALFTLLPNLGIFKDAAHTITQIPWPLTLTVFWEDACHGLPLLLLQRLIGTKKWTWPIHGLATLLIMVEFGLGHLYQGVLAAAMLSLYIPYSIKLGKKFGFGTVMVGHTLYDLTTILSLKLLLGA